MMQKRGPIALAVLDGHLWHMALGIQFVAFVAIMWCFKQLTGL